MNRATKKSLFSFAFNKWATSFQKGLYPCMLITFNISDLSNLQAVTKRLKFSAQSLAHLLKHSKKKLQGPQAGIFLFLFCSTFVIGVKNFP